MWRYPSPPTAWACRPTFCPSCFGSSPGLKATTGEAASPGGPGACHLQGDSAGPRWSHLSRERRVGHGSAVHLHDSDGRRGREQHSESTPSALDSFLAASCEGTSAHPLGGFAIHPPNCVQFRGFPALALPFHRTTCGCRMTLKTRFAPIPFRRASSSRSVGGAGGTSHRARTQPGPARRATKKARTEGHADGLKLRKDRIHGQSRETAATSATVSPLPNGPASRADRLGLVGLSSASAHSKRDRDGSWALRLRLLVLVVVAVPVPPYPVRDRLLASRWRLPPHPDSDGNSPDLLRTKLQATPGLHHIVPMTSTTLSPKCGTPSTGTGTQLTRARCLTPTRSSAGLNSTGRSTSKSTRPHILTMPQHMAKTSPPALK